MAKMIPIYLEERQERILRRVAKERKATLSSLVRAGVDLLLQELPADQDPASQIIGIGSSRKRDLGARHDEHLAAEIMKESRND